MNYFTNSFALCFRKADLLHAKPFAEIVLLDLGPHFSCFFNLLRPFFILRAVILCKETNGV